MQSAPGAALPPQCSAEGLLKTHGPRVCLQGNPPLACGVQALPLHSRTVGLGDLEATLRELAAGSADVKVLVDPRRDA